MNLRLVRRKNFKQKKIIVRNLFRDMLMVTLQNELRGILELTKEIKLRNGLGHWHEENRVGSRIPGENNRGNCIIGTGLCFLLASLIGDCKWGNS